MHPLRQGVALMLLLIILGGPPSGRACPICLGAWGSNKTLADEIMEAHAVALASSRDGTRFQIWHPLKGAAGAKGSRFTLEDGKAGASVLVARSSPGGPWFSIGSYDDRLEPFLAKTLPLRPLKVAPDRVWHEYLDLFRDDLGHADERIAKSAWQLWAKAPFRVLTSHEHPPPLRSLRSWLADEAPSYGKALWTILLGVHGEDEDRRWINKTLETAWSTNSDQGVAALLTAHCLQNGPSALPWIETRYLRNPDRTLPEIQSALAALGTIGANDDELRPQIAQIFLSFLEYRRPISGLVATDLAAWRIPDAVPHYQDLLASGEPVLPQTRRAIRAYLDAHAKPTAGDGR